MSKLQPAMANMQNALGNLQNFDTNLHRVFHVLVNELILMHLQPKVEADANLGNVSIQFSMTPSNEEELLNLLSLQKSDLAIDVGKVRESSFQLQAIYEDKMVMVARKNHSRIKNVVSEIDYYR